MLACTHACTHNRTVSCAAPGVNGAVFMERAFHRVKERCLCTSGTSTSEKMFACCQQLVMCCV